MNTTRTDVHVSNYLRRGGRGSALSTVHADHPVCCAVLGLAMAVNHSDEANVQSRRSFTGKMTSLASAASQAGIILARLTASHHPSCCSQALTSSNDWFDSLAFSLH